MANYTTSDLNLTTSQNVTTTTNIVTSPYHLKPLSGMYILAILLSIIIVIVLVAGVIFMLFKRLKLRRLRHHLMPVYNFEGGEEADYWEDQLLDHDMTSTSFYNQTSATNRQLRLKVPSSPAQSPKLKFFPQPDTPGE